MTGKDPLLDLWTKRVKNIDKVLKTVDLESKIIVYWADAHADFEDVPLTEFKWKDRVGETMGYLTYKGIEGVVVVNERFRDLKPPSYRGSTYIPLAMILKITFLQERKA